MKVLAIESSAVTASVAIMTEDTLIAEYTINYKKTHSQTLLPMIDEICRMTENNAADCDIIAVSNGPGSFTGLRIGAATGRVLHLHLINQWWQFLRLKLWHTTFMVMTGLYVLLWMQEGHICIVVFTVLRMESL